MALRNLNEWEFKKDHVQPDNLKGNQNFISSESIVLCSGPPRSADSNIDNLIPIGLIESASVIQNKQVQQLFEVGSRRPFIVPGRTRIQVGLSRVLFNGDSLLGAITRNNPEGVEPAGVEVNLQGEIDVQGRFYMNLASDFFNRPHGLGLVFSDSEDEYVALVYFEDCIIQAHQMTWGANQTVIVENCNIITDAIVPVEITGV